MDPAAFADVAPARPAYPRPQWRRERWTNLDGPWRFAFDDDDRGAARASSASRLRS